MRRAPTTRLTPAQQWFRLRAAGLDGGKGQVRNGTLTWEFYIRPSPISRRYHIRLVYRKGDVPCVVVLSPDIQSLAPGRRLPHVYYANSPLSLCLYLPGSGEWSAVHSLTDTIVPWTALWLMYFEDWLLTNDWKGGGKHPGDL